jgi:hypothetical protein
MLNAASPPVKEGEVVISFLGDEYIADSRINLGVHLLDKTKIISHSIPAKAYDDIDEYNFRDDGFETLMFDSSTLSNLQPVYSISHSLTPAMPSPPDELPEIQQSIDTLQSWMKRVYTEKTGISNIEVVCSRHMILRIAGCDSQSCHVPGNPLIHLDYIDFEKTYERQCLEQEKYSMPIKCPPKENLIDVVNIGFLKPHNIEIKDYVPVQLVGGSHAASVRHKDGLSIIYKNNMKVPEVYIFRSATESKDKMGIIHGSFRITDENVLRKSVELRCLIFSKPVESAGGGSSSSRKYSRRNRKNKNRKSKNRRR